MWGWRVAPKSFAILSLQVWRDVKSIAAGLLSTTLFRRTTSTPDPDTFEKHRDTPSISFAILLHKYAHILAESSVYTTNFQEAAQYLPKGRSRRMPPSVLHFNGVVCSNTLFSKTSALTNSLLFRTNSTCKILEHPVWSNTSGFQFWGPLARTNFLSALCGLSIFCIAVRLPFVSRYFCRSIRVRGCWNTPNYYSIESLDDSTRSPASCGNIISAVLCSANGGLPLPLEHRVCETKSKKGAPGTENPSCIGFTVLRGGLRPWSQTMVSEGARPWGRGRSEFANM